MISIFYDDNGILRRGFHTEALLHNPQPKPPTQEPPMQCQECNDTVGVLFIDPLSGKKFCDRCWRSPAFIKLREDAGYNADGSKKIIPPIPIPFKTQQESSSEKSLQIYKSTSDISTLQRCESCHALCNDTTHVSNWGYVCSTCLTDYETTPTTTTHIRMKLKSSARSIAFFHYVMGNLDSDWPWASKPIFCSVCGGAKYINPFFEAKEIKLIADNCKIGKIKISYIGEASKCEKNPTEVQTEIAAATELSAQTAADMQTILEGGHA